MSLSDNNLIVDPALTEENIANSRITVTMNVYKELCSIHKPGGMAIS